ncbi:MAG: VF530 family DNA-binding protein [Candidatus Desulfaltia sp.]|nr:VF530 family DNA-binding protein [Candidatus Desulfaltia sp.]
MSEQQVNNPLHSMTLEQIVNSLVEHYGWSEMGKRINIRFNCFLMLQCYAVNYCWYL